MGLTSDRASVAEVANRRRRTATGEFSWSDDKDPATVDAWFGRLWPLAVLLHLAGNGQHLAVMDTVGNVQLAMIVLAAVQLIRPGAAAAAGLAATYLIVLWLKMPVVGNHEVILGLVALVVLPSVALTRSAWTKTVGRPGRWILLLAYGFIAFSKLNRGFFDVVESCAIVFGDDLGRFVGWQPSNSPTAGAAVIAATAAIEVAIPLLLLRPRLRTYGVILALGFHGVLALDPTSHVWDFSATLVPLFLLFAPSGLRAWLDAGIAAIDRRPLNERCLTVAIVIAGHGALTFGAPLPLLPGWLVAYSAWLLLWGAVLGPAVVFLRRHPDAVYRIPGRSAGTQSGAPRWFSVSVGLVIMLAAANGLAPYLEIRSAAAFNMYSNLRVVDGRSNHFVLGSLRPASESPTYVGIDAVDPGSPLAYYQDRDLLLPEENLQRYLVANPDENPTLRRGDQTFPARSMGYGNTHADIGVDVHADVEVDAGLGNRLSTLITSKVLFRRAVPAADGPQQGAGDRCLRQWGPIG